MSKTMIKFLLWMLVITIFGGGFLASIYGIGSLITYFNTGADPAAALNIHPNVPLDWPVNVEWLPDDADTGREMEPFIRENVEAAYIRAWLQQGFSYTKGEPHGLKTYFTGPALAMVEDNINHVAGQELALQQVATDHLLQLHFYAADGTIAVFTDRQARVAQHIKDGEGQEVMAEEDLAAYQVVMMVDEGNWKVRHWLRRDLQDYGAERPLDETLTPPAEELVRVENGQLMLGDDPYEIRGFNYYPQAHTWTDMWSEYEGNTISDDMALMSAMGMNTVRIFVPYELFGADEVVDAAPDYLQRLRDVLNEAWRHDLRVIVTLYDFKSDYNLLTWPKADRHLEEILTTFNRHPAILAWDIKNEPDLDYDAAGEELVNIWLKHAVDQARVYDPYHLITIGWAHAENADELAEMVDFVSFHFYAPADEFIDTVAKLKIEVGADKPVMLGEFGLPTWNSRFFPNGHSEEEQYNYLRELLLLMDDGSTAGYLAWTLYDFTHVPSQVAGRLPWKRSPQKQMGIIRPDGTQKPAADLFKQPVSLDLLETPLAETGWLKPFYQTVLIGLFMFMVVGVYALWRVYQYILDRFGHDVVPAEENGEVDTAQAIQPKYSLRQKLWRTWRARRLLKWRKRRDRRYAKWDRRKARRQRRQARRKAWWLKATNVVRVIFGRPVQVDDTIETNLRKGHSSTRMPNGETFASGDQGSETMDNNEFKPLIEIPEGVKELQSKLNAEGESLLSGESDAQTTEKPLKTKEELIRELLAPVESLTEPDVEETVAEAAPEPLEEEAANPEPIAEADPPVAVADKSPEIDPSPAPSTVEVEITEPVAQAPDPPAGIDPSQVQTIVSMKVPSVEEIAELKAAIEAEKEETNQPSKGVEILHKRIDSPLAEITIDTVTPDTTEIYDIGIDEFDPTDSPVQLVYEKTAEGFKVVQSAEEKADEAQHPPIAPLAQNKEPVASTPIDTKDAQELLDNADYSSGTPVIRIDLNEKPADWIGEPKVEKSAEQPAPNQPGDGFSIESTTLPPSENEFSQEQETIWPNLSQQSTKAPAAVEQNDVEEAEIEQTITDSLDEIGVPEIATVMADGPTTEGTEQAEITPKAEFNKVVADVDPQPILEEGSNQTLELVEPEMVEPEVEKIEAAAEAEEVEAVIEENQETDSQPVFEAKEEVQSVTEAESTESPVEETEDASKGVPSESEDAHDPEPETPDSKESEPPVEPEADPADSEPEEQQNGLTKEEIERFFSWEN